jgi:hypothetical protein
VAQNQASTLVSIKRFAVQRALEFAACQLDALATLLALQAHIHAKLVNGPASTPARMGFFEDDPLSDLPWREWR